MFKYIRPMCLAMLLVYVLPSETGVVEITKDTSKEVLARSKDKIVIIDFYADWCQPCKLMAPIFETVAQKLDNKYVFAKANFDQLQELAQTFGVVMLPTFVVVKDEKLAGKITGMVTENDFEARIVQAITETDYSTLTADQLRDRMRETIMTCDTQEAKKILAIKGFDINQPFADGLNPLSYALLFAPNFGPKGYEFVQVLLDAGASLDYKITIQQQTVTVFELANKQYESLKTAADAQEKMISFLKEYQTKTGKPSTK